MRKYHYDLRRRRARPATAGLVGAWTARTAFMHHLPRLSVFAPPHPPLGTQNEVPIAMCMKLSRCHRGQGRYISHSLGWAGTFAPWPYPPFGLSFLKNIPLLFISFSGQNDVVSHRFSSKNFSRLRIPRWILSFTELTELLSALAISALLMPRK